MVTLALAGSTRPPRHSGDSPALLRAKENVGMDCSEFQKAVATNDEAAETKVVDRFEKDLAAAKRLGAVFGPSPWGISTGPCSVSYGL